MRIYKCFNTLKYDSWTKARFYITPSIAVLYDKNEIDGEFYCKSLWITFDFLCVTVNFIFEWDKHKQLL